MATLPSLTLIELSRLLAERRSTSRELVERALAAIKDPAGEGVRAFIAVHEAAALATADRVDALRRQGASLPVLAGIPISIKDNFDEAGHVTVAGSKVLLDAAPASRDATVVARLREAGAVIVGRTNMTEFAYSGLGINPHYGTPRNAFDRANARLPGGSSSGAAISITDAMASAAIGTDTGGSVRIPAALNGLVGFKPTASRVPLDGVLPLSTTLDSAGPVARTVADCALLDQVLTRRSEALAVPQMRGLRFAVPQSIVLDDLAPEVAKAFAAALARLSAAGATIVEAPLTDLLQAASINPGGALVSAEAFAWHRPWLERSADRYDPRVLGRIRPGAAVAAADYAELMQRRRQFIAAMNHAAREYDALLMPTTPDPAPLIADVLKDDASYFHWNVRMLRNPSLVNLFDGCALSIPCHEPGTPPVGLMIAGVQHTDRWILAIGCAIETTLAPSRM